MRFDVPAGERAFVSMPLVSVRDLSLPADISLLRWDAAAQRYADVAADYSPLPGDAFWIENNAAETRRVFLTGYVVMDETRTLRLQPALNAIGFPFTSAGGSMELGRGSWFENKATGTVAWTMSRPYGEELASIELPLISDISAKGDRVMLNVLTAGGHIEVLAQDLEPDGNLTEADAWLLVGAVDGRGVVSWTDAVPEQVYARIYQVRAIDSFENSTTGYSGLVTWSDEGAEVQLESDVNAIDDDLVPEDSTAVEPGSLSGSDAARPVSNQVQYVRRAQRTIYVNGKQGDDRLSGRSNFKAGLHGPKRSVRAGLAAAMQGDRMIVHDGAYREDLDIAGRLVSVRVAGNASLAGIQTNRLQRPVASDQSATNGVATTEEQK